MNLLKAIVFFSVCVSASAEVGHVFLPKSAIDYIVLEKQKGKLVESYCWSLPVQRDPRMGAVPFDGDLAGHQAKFGQAMYRLDELFHAKRDSIWEAKPPVKGLKSAPEALELLLFLHQAFGDKREDDYKDAPADAAILKQVEPGAESPIAKALPKKPNGMIDWGKIYGDREAFNRLYKATMAGSGFEDLVDAPLSDLRDGKKLEAFIEKVRRAGSVGSIVTAVPEMKATIAAFEKTKKLTEEEQAVVKRMQDWGVFYQENEAVPDLKKILEKIPSLQKPEELINAMKELVAFAEKEKSLSLVQTTLLKELILKRNEDFSDFRVKAEADSLPTDTPDKPTRIIPFSFTVPKDGAPTVELRRRQELTELCSEKKSDPKEDTDGEKLANDLTLINEVSLAYHKLTRVYPNKREVKGIPHGLTLRMRRMLAELDPQVRKEFLELLQQKLTEMATGQVSSFAALDKLMEMLYTGVFDKKSYAGLKNWALYYGREGAARDAALAPGSKIDDSIRGFVRRHQIAFHRQRLMALEAMLRADHKHIPPSEILEVRRDAAAIKIWLGNLNYASREKKKPDEELPEHIQQWQDALEEIAKERAARTKTEKKNVFDTAMDLLIEGSNDAAAVAKERKNDPKGAEVADFALAALQKRRDYHLGKSQSTADEDKEIESVADIALESKEWTGHNVVNWANLHRGIQQYNKGGHPIRYRQAVKHFEAITDPKFRNYIQSRSLLAAAYNKLDAPEGGVKKAISILEKIEVPPPDGQEIVWLQFLKSRFELLDKFVEDSNGDKLKQYLDEITHLVNTPPGPDGKKPPGRTVGKAEIEKLASYEPHRVYLQALDKMRAGDFEKAWEILQPLVVGPIEPERLLPYFRNLVDKLESHPDSSYARATQNRLKLLNLDTLALLVRLKAHLAVTDPKKYPDAKREALSALNVWGTSKLMLGIPLRQRRFARQVKEDWAPKADTKEAKDHAERMRQQTENAMIPILVSFTEDTLPKALDHRVEYPSLHIDSLFLGQVYEAIGKGDEAAHIYYKHPLPTMHELEKAYGEYASAWKVLKRAETQNEAKAGTVPDDLMNLYKKQVKVADSAIDIAKRRFNDDGRAAILYARTMTDLSVDENGKADPTHPKFKEAQRRLEFMVPAHSWSELHWENGTPVQRWHNYDGAWRIYDHPIASQNKNDPDAIYGTYTRLRANNAGSYAHAHPHFTDYNEAKDRLFGPPRPKWEASDAEWNAYRTKMDELKALADVRGLISYGWQSADAHLAYAELWEKAGDHVKAYLIYQDFLDRAWQGAFGGKYYGSWIVANPNVYWDKVYRAAYHLTKWVDDFVKDPGKTPDQIAKAYGKAGLHIQRVARDPKRWEKEKERYEELFKGRPKLKEAFDHEVALWNRKVERDALADKNSKTFPWNEQLMKEAKASAIARGKWCAGQDGTLKNDRTRRNGELYARHKPEFNSCRHCCQHNYLEWPLWLCQNNCLLTASKMFGASDIVIGSEDDKAEVEPTRYCRANSPHSFSEKDMLPMDEAICSPNGRFLMQWEDNRFVVYNFGRKIWKSPQGARYSIESCLLKVKVTTAQEANKVVWSSNNFGHGWIDDKCRIEINDDGNVVMKGTNREYWSWMTGPIKQN